MEIPPIERLREICQNSRVRVDKLFFPVPPRIRTRRYFRFLSIYITRILLYTPLSANHITLLNTCVGILGSFFFSFGGFWSVALGTFFFLAFTTLDYVDGEVARFRKQTSMKGHYLGLLSHFIVETAMDLGITVGAFRLAGRYEVLLLGACMILLGVLNKFVVSIHYRTVLYHLQIGYEPPKKVSQITDKPNLNRATRRGIFRLILSPSVVSMAMLFLLYKFIPLWFLTAVGLDTVGGLREIFSSMCTNRISGFVELFILSQVVGRLIISIVVPVLIFESRMMEKTYVQVRKWHHGFMQSATYIARPVWTKTYLLVDRFLLRILQYGCLFSYEPKKSNHLLF